MFGLAAESGVRGVCGDEARESLLGVRGWPPAAEGMTSGWRSLDETGLARSLARPPSTPPLVQPKSHRNHLEEVKVQSTVCAWPICAHEVASSTSKPTRSSRPKLLKRARRLRTCQGAGGRGGGEWSARGRSSPYGTGVEAAGRGGRSGPRAQAAHRARADRHLARARPQEHLRARHLRTTRRGRGQRARAATAGPCIRQSTGTGGRGWGGLQAGAPTCFKRSMSGSGSISK